MKTIKILLTKKVVCKNKNMSSNMKKNAGYAAANFIENGMVVGLGTGSTVYYFIEHLVQRQKDGLVFTAVTSSLQSEKQALEGGIEIIPIDSINSIDITVDGADEITHHKQMIKGGGGALLREKILANMSKEMVVIVDEEKVVNKLGKHPLPIEILPFAHKAIIEKIKLLGFVGSLRHVAENTPFITENGHYIYDIRSSGLIDDPEKDDAKIRHIPGVLETGYFFNLAGRVIIGKKDGTLEEWPM